MKKLYISRKMPEQFVRQLTPYYDIVEWEETAVPAPAAFFASVQDNVDAVWCLGGDRFGESNVSASSKLKLIANFGVGYNNLQVDYLSEQGIAIANTPNVLNDATADLAFTLMLATARRIPQNMQFILKGEWQGWDPYLGSGVDISHKTIGIIGMGKIGETVAKRATGFDMNIIYHNRRPNEQAEKMYGAQYRTLHALLEEADFVVIFAPLTEETRNMITLNELKCMKKTAVLINAARGGIVNEQDLHTALKEGIIWAAGTDVFEVEPTKGSHPLFELDNFVATPHIGSATMDTRHAMMQLNIDSLIAFVKGEPIPSLVYESKQFI